MTTGNDSGDGLHMGGGWALDVAAGSTLVARDVAGPTALLLPDGLGWEAWEAWADPVLLAAAGGRWWLGDLAVYAEDNLVRRNDKGHPNPQDVARVRQALTQVAGVALQTIKNATSIARRFPPHRRRAALDWSMHRAVMALDPDVADLLLDEAERDGWVVADMVAAVREAQAIPVKSKPEASPRGDGTVRVSLEVPPQMLDHVDHYRELVTLWAPRVPPDFVDLLKWAVDGLVSAAEKAGKRAA
jgi:hypothetical protein